MKLIKYIVILLLLIPSYAFSWGSMIAGSGGGAAAASCQAGTGAQWVGPASLDYYTLGAANTFNNWQYVAIASGSYEICKAEITFAVASGTDTFAVKLCDDNACTTNCVSADATKSTSTTGAGEKLTFDFTTTKTVTTDFYVCHARTGTTGQQRVGAASDNGYFGTSAANKNSAAAAGVHNDYDVSMTLWYVQ